MNLGGIDLFQNAFIQSQQFFDGGTVAVQVDDRLFRSPADLDNAGQIHFLGQLSNQHAAALLVPQIVHTLTANEADVVSEGHLHHCFAQTVFYSPAGFDLTGHVQLVEALPCSLTAFSGGFSGAEHIYRMVCFLKFGSQHLILINGCDGKGNQRGRHIIVHERAGHGVLTADSGSPQLQLCIQCAKQCSKGLAPTGRLIAKSLKELLQGQINLFIVSTGCNQFRNATVDSGMRTGVGIHAHMVGIHAPGKYAALVGKLTGQGRQNRCHCLSGGTLGLTAERHQHRAGADRAVKALNQTSAAGGIQIRCHFTQTAVQALAEGGQIFLRNLHGGMFACTVGIQKCSAQAGNFHTLPLHNHPGLFGNNRHAISFQVFFLSMGNKLIGIFSSDHNSHTLLRFRDSNFGAVQTVIFLADSVKVNAQAVSQFADGNGYTAGAEVIAALDQTGNLGIAEQALDLPLFGGVALLNFGSHGGKALHVVALGRTGSTADAVTAGTAAQQDDHITGCGTFPAHIVSRGSANHSATLQPLGNETVVVDFSNVAGSQADLVAVGRVASGCSLAQLTLGQLACQSLLQRLPGIGSTGDTHSLVDIGTATEGVTDTAADTGSSAAERLDFSGMVVCLVLEHQQPILILTIDFSGNMDGAGVDLFAFVQLGQQAAFLQGLCTDGGNIHQRLGTLGSLLFAVDLHTGSQIALVSIGNRGIVDLHIVNDGGKSGMTAVVRPVGVDHPDFGNGGIPVFLSCKIVLQELQVIQIHGKTQGIQKLRQSSFIHGDKAGNSRNALGQSVLYCQSFGHFQRSFPAFHRVNDMLLDGGDLIVRQCAFQHIDLGGADSGTVTLAQDLNTLGSGVCPLVELTGQRLYGEHDLACGHFVGDGIHLRLRENRIDTIAKEGFINIFNIITVQYTNTFQTADLQKILNFLQQAVSFVGLTRFLFNIYAVNHGGILLIYMLPDPAGRYRFCGRHFQT